MTLASRILPVLLLSLTLTACGTSERTTSDGSASEGGPNRIVVDELSAPVDGMTAYDLVRHYKSNWLEDTGHHSLQNSPEIQVYINNSGSSAGTVSSLKKINAVNVASIEYFKPSEAQFRFGLGNSVGAILVHLKSGS